MVRVSWANQFAGDVAPTDCPTSTRSAWVSRRSFSWVTWDSRRATSSSAASVSAVDIDHTGVPTTEARSSRADATVVATG